MSNPLIYVDLIHSPQHDTSGRWQPWRVIVKSGDNQKPLFESTEAYTNRADAIHAAQIAFGNQSNVYLREHEHGDVLLRLADNQRDSQ